MMNKGQLKFSAMFIVIKEVDAVNSSRKKKEDDQLIPLYFFFSRLFCFTAAMNVSYSFANLFILS